MQQVLILNIRCLSSARPITALCEPILRILSQSVEEPPDIKEKGGLDREKKTPNKRKVSNEVLAMKIETEPRMTVKNPSTSHS